MGLRTFTATYRKGSDLIIDISFNEENEKLVDLGSFILYLKENNHRYTQSKEGIILTILVYLDHEQKESGDQIINKFYSFTN